MDFPAATDAALYHESVHAGRGMVAAPHIMAAEAGCDVLAEGGNALEAAIATAAASAVLCPHMSHLGGDGVWIIRTPSGRVHHITACGQIGGRATIRHYHDLGLERIPTRGPQAILTVPGAVAGWSVAMDAARAAGGRMSLARLLERAMHHAREGAPASDAMLHLAQMNLEDLRGAPGFCDIFMQADETRDELRLLKPGAPLYQHRLADTLDHLARAGLQDFYSGDVGREIAADLERIGSPLNRTDLESYRAQEHQPVQVHLKAGTLYSAPPPAPGLTILTILALLERLNVQKPESPAHLHGLIEATKQALLARNRQMKDLALSSEGAPFRLSPNTLDDMAACIDSSRAQVWHPTWSRPASPPLSLWIGAADASGLVVSYAQSLHSTFGSGCVLPGTGILMQNQGTDFSLEPDSPAMLHPGGQALHGMSPALAQLRNGRVIACGATGGDDHMQAQSAIFSRHVMFAMPLGQSIARPRWHFAHEPGGEHGVLRLEGGFEDAVLTALRRSGHSIEMLPDIWSEEMGQAGAVVLHANGMLKGADDPRGSGCVRGI